MVKGGAHSVPIVQEPDTPMQRECPLLQCMPPAIQRPREGRARCLLIPHLQCSAVHGQDPVQHQPLHQLLLCSIIPAVHHQDPSLPLCSVVPAVHCQDPAQHQPLHQLLNQCVRCEEVVGSRALDDGQLQELQSMPLQR